MEIAFFAQDFLEPSARLLHEASEARGHLLHDIDFTHVRLSALGPKRWGLFHRGKKLDSLDVAIPRVFGTRYLEFKLNLIEHLELIGVPVLNSAEVIRVCKNKFRTAQFLQRHRIPTPAARLTISPQAVLRSISKMRKPVILKLLGGSQGKGVMKLSDNVEAMSVLESFEQMGEMLLLQDFIPNRGEDYRVFVIGEEPQYPIIRRKAKKGEFRTNIHSGGKGSPIRSGRDDLVELAARCAQKLGSDVLGVDIVEGSDGLSVLELNSSPGFNRDFRARGIIEHAERKVRR